MRLVVLGGGESGVGTAILGKKKGYAVLCLILEKLKIQERPYRHIEWEEEGHTEDLILNATVVMKSPGIPDKVHCKETG
jgi:UDP-N-acetylmuramoylalanine--D-glutamate ligase